MITVKDIEKDKSFSYYYENVGRDARSKILQHFHRGANYTVTVQRINPSNRAADYTFTTGKLASDNLIMSCFAAVVDLTGGTRVAQRVAFQQ